MHARDDKSALAAMLARMPGQIRTSMAIAWTGLDKKKGARACSTITLIMLSLHANAQCVDMCSKHNT